MLTVALTVAGTQMNQSSSVLERDVRTVQKSFAICALQYVTQTEYHVVMP